MGKKNKGGNGYREPNLPPSFFQQQRQKLGSDFMNRINTEIVKKNAVKIFKDLASGAINVDHEYEFFNVYDFTYALKDSAIDNARYNWACNVGLQSNPMTASDPFLQLICQEHYERYMLYQTISGHLDNILMNITQFGGVYTRHLLTQLVAEIRWKSKVFNGNFITILPGGNTKNIKQERRVINNGQGFSNKSEGGIWDKSNKDNM